MKQVRVIKAGVIVQTTNFETDQKADDFVVMLKRSKPWGDFAKGEFSVETEDVTQRVADQQVFLAASDFLKSTDWMIIREMETGIKASDAVKAARADARSKLKT